MDDLQLAPKEFDLFRKLIYTLTGISMHEGKRQMLQSRLQRRIRKFGISTFREYYDHISGLPESDPEWINFINCVTTNKTDFFREPHHFEFVENVILPGLIKKIQQGEHEPKLRVWHAGCSSGEEPYTLGIVLSQTPSIQSWDIRQLASDIDTNVLEGAEQGVYDRDRVRTIPEATLKRHFLRGSGESKDLYKVKPYLKDRIAFRRINLLDEPWPIRPDVEFDIIFCRNVIIYFDKPTQSRLFCRFEERLAPGGYLFLGHSETLHGPAIFDLAGHTIFRKPEQQITQKAA